MSHFVTENAKGESFRLGFNVSDAEYYRRTGELTKVPDELKDQAFLKSIGSPAGYAPAPPAVGARAPSGLSRPAHF